MPIDKTEWIYFNGEWVRWEDATVHVSTHALHYGTSAFEGIRAYESDDGPAIFRLDRHMRRLLDSSKMLRFDMGDHDVDRLSEICVELVARSGLDSCYIRPIVFRGAGTMGVHPGECPVEVVMFCFPWGRYLGEEAIEGGVDAEVSSWRRFAPSTTLPLGKIGGQYVPNHMVSIESRANGFAEGIMLDAVGHVAEGAGENLFLVHHGRLITPPIATGILEGITRDSVMILAEDLGIPVVEEPVAREMLYICDELFMTGTAAEITPVRSVDRVPVGDGSRGPVTRALQEEFFGILEGRDPDRHGWLTRVGKLEQETAAAD